MLPQSCFHRLADHSVSQSQTSLERGPAYVLGQEKGLDHRRLVRLVRAGGGRGETLVPLAGAGVTVACLQEGALQFADVGLVLAQLRGRIRVLDQQTTNTQEEVRGGAGRGGEAGGDHHRKGPCMWSREGAGVGIGSSRR